MGFFQTLLEGTLEGHESPTERNLTRAVFIIFYGFATWSVIANFINISHAGFEVSSLITSTVIGVLCVVNYLLTSWYRQDGLDPKFKKLILCMMTVILLLCVASTMEFNTTQKYSPPPPVTPCPTPPPTPTPTPKPPAPTPNSTNHSTMIFSNVNTKSKIPIV
eukprot:PhM_4_TR13057/c0_g1_i1/m.100883